MMESTKHADIYLPNRATVLEVKPMTEFETFFRFETEYSDARAYKPGQFMEISVPGYGEAPISISSSPTHIEPGRFEMVVRKVGNLTEKLHTLDAGDWVGVRGPFGTHFPVENGLRGRDVLFVCGGLGLVPVRSAIQYVLDNRDNYGRVIILYGTRRPADRLFRDELYYWALRDDVEMLETVDAADDHWTGRVGVITTLFQHVSLEPAKTTAIVCGPPIMYRFVLKELHGMGIASDRVYVSLERHMKCGVGKCGHCQINHLYVCQKGPVFCLSDVEHLREAV